MSAPTFYLRDWCCFAVALQKHPLSLAWRLQVLALAVLCCSTSLAFAVTNEIQYLSGTDKDHTVSWDFRVSAGRNAGFWTNIPVPSCWDTKGFGTYEYGNDTTSEFGQYRHPFSVPAAWKDRRVFLVFEGAMTDTEPKINGRVPGATVSANGLPNERAFDNTTAAGMGATGGIAANTDADTLNLGELASFTLTCWVKPESDFSRMPYNRFPRLFVLGADAGYDGNTTNGAFLTIYHGPWSPRSLQFKINSDYNAALSAPNLLTGNDWTFIAVTYDSTLAAGNVNFYVGNKSVPLGAAATTVNYPRGPVNFGPTAFAYLLNNASRERAFKGFGDDFRIFRGALPPAQLESVRAAGLAASRTAPRALYQWDFNQSTSETSVPPNLGARGVLTLQDAKGTATDLYTAIGSGVSSSGARGTVVHQGGFYQFSYDVTSNLVFGATTNLLETTVYKKSANTTVNKAERQSDYWTFGGIFRPVYLEARPRAQIERVVVDAQQDGRIAIHAFTSGATPGQTITARVLTTNLVPLGAEFVSPVMMEEEKVILSATLPPPALWSPEFPNLYQLEVELRDGTNVLHTLHETIGFRTITFTNHVGFFLNGKRIILRGVNRHEFWPTHGRTSSRAQSSADIELIKSMNMNAVRMSHYPPAKHFLEECDRLGLLVIDELAGWQAPAYDNSVAPRLVREMVTRDANHPCIFAWANGNEGGFNATVDKDFCLWELQNRKVLHPANWESETTGGVRTHHYAPYATFTNYLGAGKTVFMPTEIQHGLFDGGAGAALEDHWNAMRLAPNGGGMFLWALLDEGVVRDDRDGAIDIAGDQAPDGILGPFREKEASYYAIKAIWSPVQIKAPDLATFDGSVTMENRFDFTDLNQCKFRWQLGWFPDPTNSTVALNAGFTIAEQSGELVVPSVPPGATGSLNLGVPADWLQYDALRLTATDPSGREIYTWTWPIHPAAQISARLVSAWAAPEIITAGHSGSELIITNGPRVWRFDASSGRLNGVKVSGRPLALANGPRPVVGVWPGPNITAHFDGAEYVITVNNATNAANGFEWRLQPDGWVRLRYHYTLTGAQNWFGVTFDYPETNVTAMRWLGQGPYRVWKNRLAGQEVAVHFKTANDTDTGKQWGYPEFRGYHGQLHWASVATTELPFTVVTPTPNLYLRMLTPPVASTGRPGVSPVFPPGNISFLHAINAIGNKFDLAENTGPAGLNPIAAGRYSGELFFFVGSPLPR